MTFFGSNNVDLFSPNSCHWNIPFIIIFLYILSRTRLNDYIRSKGQRSKEDFNEKNNDLFH